MGDPTHQDLYVMQNQFGLIKIGRSLDIRQRCTTLQFSERCKIKVVAVYSKCGDLEESIHFRVKEHRLAGEWFNGTELARNAIMTALGDDEPVDWPYLYDAERAQSWLNHLAALRQADYVRRAIYRQERILVLSDGPHEVHDYSVLGAVHFALYGQPLEMTYARVGGNLVRHWRNVETGKFEPIPTYTSDIEAALTIWPADVRPTNWNGTAMDCCIEALRAIRGRLPKVPRPQRTPKT